MASPFGSDAVQPPGETTLLGESSRLSFDLSIQERTGHTEESGQSTMVLYYFVSGSHLRFFCASRKPWLVSLSFQISTCLSVVGAPTLKALRSGLPR